MSRYISVDILLSHKFKNDISCNAYHNLIKGDAHTVDAIELVRCKDCKYYEIYELKSDGTDDRRYKPSVCVREKYAVHRKPDWFCADGERR